MIKMITKKLSLLSLSIFLLSFYSHAESTLSIVDFGALGDGSTLNTGAIQSTIDAAKDGDTVLIPSGTFLSGALFVKSNMTLQVEGTLLGSPDEKDYPIILARWEGREKVCYASLITGGSINTEDRAEVAIENFTITGPGTIDANGDGGLKASQEEVWRGARSRLIYFAQGKNIKLEETTFKHSPAWGIHFVYCKDILIDGSTITMKVSTTAMELILIPLPMSSSAIPTSTAAMTTSQLSPEKMKREGRLEYQARILR